jgi:hypothetical protein
LLFAVALIIGGAQAVVPMLSCLLTFAVLWVLLRFQLLRRRNGVFAAVGLVALLGAIIPLIERGYVALAESSRTNAARPVTAAEAAGSSIPSLVQEFAITSPDTSVGEFVKVTRDSRVIVDEKPYLLKSGDVFPLEERSAKEVTFSAKDLRISLPAGAVEVFGKPAEQAASNTAAATLPKANPAPPDTTAASPPAETPAQATLRAQQEAIRKYPGLGVRDSPENESFLRAVSQLKTSGSILLTDPQWPLELADILAKREGWGGEPPAGNQPPPAVEDETTESARSAPEGEEMDAVEPADPAPGADAARPE